MSGARAIKSLPLCNIACSPVSARAFVKGKRPKVKETPIDGVSRDCYGALIRRVQKRQISTGVHVDGAADAAMVPMVFCTGWRGTFPPKRVGSRREPCPRAR